MATATEPIPGTSDIWEPDVRDWVLLETAARTVFSRYGYGELRTPVFERTDVFVRSIGDETDVVTKEMYTFEDRGGRSLTLRPEGTAGVIRAVANSGLAQGEEKRVFYFGPMFRGERPAAGRKRQFHQVGVEAVGACNPYQDAECIAMLVHYLEEVGIPNGRVLINTRGVKEDRDRVGEALRTFFSPRRAEMCEDCTRRFDTNVWRILDCKNETCSAIAEQAPRMIDLIGDESRLFFEAVCKALDSLGVTYELAPRLVRGLDYYEHTVWEIVHSGLGAQDALAGGGRYRISIPGGGKEKTLEGVGFAAGMERLLMARESLGLKASECAGADLFIASIGEGSVAAGLTLAATIRRELSLRVLADCTARSMKAQMRTANRVGAGLVLIRGEDEIRRDVVLCKNMTTSEQVEVPTAGVVDWLRANGSC